jgi:hypothetical protein
MDRNPLYRSYGKQEALAWQREEFEKDAAFEQMWLGYMGTFKDAGNFVRHAGEPFGDANDAQGRPFAGLVPRKVDETRNMHKRWAAIRAKKKAGLSDPEHAFRHQGSADLNSYKLFVEQAHALLKVGGQLGLVTPSGLYTDQGSVDLRKLLIERCNWQWLYGFENRHKIFDIDSRFKFAVIIAQKGSKTTALQAAFMRHELEDWGEARGALLYPAERFHAFSPTTLAVLEIRSSQDLEVLAKVYANSVLLGEEGPDGWGIRYVTEFHMTNDSKFFVSRDKAEEAGYVPDPYGRWVGPEGDTLLPLYEGRMIGQFDFSKKGWVSGKGRSAVWRDIPWDKKVIEPQFLMRPDDYVGAGDGDGQSKVVRGLKVGFMDVSSATNTRTMIAALTYDLPHGNKVPVLVARNSLEYTRSSAALCALLNSYSYDFVMRARLGGLTLNYFIVEETPLPKLRNAEASIDVLAIEALALGAPHERFAGAWEALRDSIGSAVPWRTRWALSPAQRLRSRCIIDAIAAALYGLSESDVRWMLRDCDYPKKNLTDKAFCKSLDPKGFWRIDKDQDPELRHTVLTIVAFMDLARLIADRDDDVARGIAAFASLNGGDGWTLPMLLCLKDYDLGHDDRAGRSQPVSERLGRRYWDTQLQQGATESWTECEHHSVHVNVPPERAHGTATGSSVATERIREHRTEKGKQLDMFGKGDD